VSFLSTYPANMPKFGAVAAPVGKGSVDSGRGLEAVVYRLLQQLEAATANELAAKVVTDIGLGLERPLLTLPTRDIGAGKEFVLYASKGTFESGAGKDVISVLTRIIKELASGTEKTYPCRLYGIDLDAFKGCAANAPQLLAKLISMSSMFRYVKQGDEARASDYNEVVDVGLGLKDLCICMFRLVYDNPRIYSVWAQGLGPRAVEELLKHIQNMRLKAYSGDVIAAEDWNNMYKLLCLLQNCISYLDIGRPSGDSGKGSDVSILKDASSLFQNLYVYVRDTGNKIYMNTANVKWNMCPSAWTSTQCRASCLDGTMSSG